MKKNLFVLALLFLQFTMTYGQMSLPAGIKMRHPIPAENSSLRLQSPNSRLMRQGAPASFWLDYSAADGNYAALNGIYFYFLFWAINNSFRSGPPMDTSGNFTCKWAAVQFDTLYDYMTELGYPYAGTGITIDSIALWMNHQNYSGQNDTLIVSVLARANNASGFTTTNNYITVSNTVLWDTSIITNTALTPGIPTNQASVFVLPCGSSLPAGQRFIIKVDYKGPQQDTLYLADFNRDDCRFSPPPPDEFVNASLSIFPDNSWRYLNLFFPPSTNLNGIGSLVFQNADPLCDWFYFQNWGITPLVTIAAPFRLTGSQSATDICPGDTVTLSVTPLGGTPPYSVQWLPPTGLNNSFSFTTQATIFNTTTYSVTVTDMDGATATASFTITVNGITVDAGSDQAITCGDTAYLVATPGGVFIPSLYQWSNGVSTLNNPVTQTGTYSITATNSFGCTATDMVVVSCSALSQVSISGNVNTEMGSAVNTVTLTATGTSTSTDLTDINGNYSLTFNSGEDVTLTPSKSNDITTNNGITTLDILLIRRHVLNIALLNSPYKIIAADVNGSNSVTTADILFVRSVILQINQTFPNGRLWAFTPDDYVFAAPQNPFPFPNNRIYNNLSADMTGQDFIGMKLGDVNNDWNPNVAKAAAVGSVQFAIDEYTVMRGDEIRIPVRIKDFRNITGYQFTLSWNPEVLEFLDVKDKALETHYGTMRIADGFLTTSWNDDLTRAITLRDDETVFELRFKVIGETGSFSPIVIGSELTASEAYNENLDMLNIVHTKGMVKVGDVSTVVNLQSKICSLSVQPNPFSHSTQIFAVLPDDAAATISIYDILGKLVKQMSLKLHAGENKIEWKGDDDSGNSLNKGLYLIRMTTGNYSAGVKAELSR